VVKDADDEYSDRKWEDVQMMVKKEVVKQVAVEVVVEKQVVVMEKEEEVVSLVVVAVEVKWEESKQGETKVKKVNKLMRLCR
jgi:hypothetical protein